MKKEKTSITEQLSEYLKSQKDSFRQHQRDLPFSEKMEIAFSLSERDKKIQQSVLLPKNKKKDKPF
jgi:ribosomal protein L1